MSQVTSITVENGVGTFLAGAAIKVLNGDGSDVTTALFGKSPVFTNAQGVFGHVWSTNAPILPPDIRLLQVSAPGYETSVRDTDPEYTGSGYFSFTLLPLASAGLTIVSQPPDYVSALQPVVMTVQATPQSTWQIVEATVVDFLTGRESTIEAPVDATGLVSFNLQSRFRLPSAHRLITTGAGANDNDMIREYGVSFAVLNESGRVQSTVTFSLFALNVQPRGRVNDLSNLAGKWLMSWPELVVYTGHYVDASALLAAVPNGSTLAISTQFYNASRQPLHAVSDTLSGVTGGVVRIRPRSSENGARFAQLFIHIDGISQTDTLNVRYE